MGNEIIMRPSNELSLFGLQNMADMVTKAEIMIRSGFLPKAYQKPEAVIMACTIGAELGFSPMQSLNVINVIDGKPTLGINGCLALVQKNGGFIETLELSDTTCKIRVSRPGRPEHIEEYTLVDASRAGLTGKQNWVKMPKNMLYARATSNGIRRVYADILSGLYTTEEMQDATGQQLSEESTRATQPRSRATANSGCAVKKAVESAVVDAILDAEEMEQCAPEPALPVGNPDKSNSQLTGEIDVESGEHIAFVCTANAPYESTAYDYGRKLAVALQKRGVKLEDVGQALKERFERLTAGG